MLGRQEDHGMLDRRARYGEAMFSIYPPDAMEDVSEIQV